MAEGDSTLPSMTKNAFMALFKDFTAAFTKSTKDELASTVRNEVTMAIAPLEAKQNALHADLESTKSQLSGIILDNAQTKTRLDSLQQQISSQSRTPPPLLPSSGFLQRPIMQPSLQQTTSDDALQVIRHAKKILGFSPISQSDIEQ